MDQWKWVPKDALDCSPTYNIAKSQLAAQRWSDKRDKISAPATSFGALQATREAKRSTAISSDIQVFTHWGRSVILCSSTRQDVPSDIWF
jgi:hypothetical protein